MITVLVGLIVIVSLIIGIIGTIRNQSNESNNTMQIVGFSLFACCFFICIFLLGYFCIIKPRSSGPPSVGTKGQTDLQPILPPSDDSNDKPYIAGMYDHVPIYMPPPNLSNYQPNPYGRGSVYSGTPFQEYQQVEVP
jgi:hypothetical protein